MSKKSIYRFTKVGIIIAVQIVFFASSLIAFAASMDEELIQAASKNDLNAVNDLISRVVDGELTAQEALDQAKAALDELIQ